MGLRPYGAPLMIDASNMLGCGTTAAPNQLPVHPNTSQCPIVGILRQKLLSAPIPDTAFEVLTPPNPDYRKLVSTIRVPILLVIGAGANAVVSLDTARELRNSNPRLQIEQIEDAGHGLHYDQPSRIAAAVSSFLLR